MARSQRDSSSTKTDDKSGDETTTTLTLTNSEDGNMKKFAKDEYLNIENMRKNGWCNADGTPWVIKRPKDEAALLKGGLTNVHGNRKANELVLPPSDGYFDEIELVKQGLAAQDAQQRTQPKQDYAKNNPNVQLNRNNSPTVMQYGHYGLKNDPSVENYITDAEVNTRGYKDRMGRIFYAIPLIERTNKTAPRQQNQPQQQRKESQKAPNMPTSRTNVVVTSQRSERSIRDYNPNVTSNSAETLSAEDARATAKRIFDSGKTADANRAKIPQKANGVHEIDCDVGSGVNRGHLRYSVQNDGRSYYLKGPNDCEILLEFNRKGASLISKCGSSGNQSKWIPVNVGPDYEENYGSEADNNDDSTLKI